MFKLKGLIFDVDGVVVNTIPLHFKAWKRMFSDYGIIFSFDDYKKKVDGIPRLDGARAILTDLSDDELKEAASRKQKYFLDYLRAERVQAYEDTYLFIKGLKRDIIKVAVASSSKNCREVLKNADLYDIFDAIIDGYEFKKGKPEPEIFINAAKKLNLEPSECVVFEDAKLGVEAAKNGNMFCVGIDRINRPRLLNEADIVIKDFSEINFEKIKELFESNI